MAPCMTVPGARYSVWCMNVAFASSQGQGLSSPSKHWRKVHKGSLERPCTQPDRWVQTTPQLIFPSVGQALWQLVGPGNGVRTGFSNVHGPPGLAASLKSGRRPKRWWVKIPSARKIKNRFTIWSNNPTSWVYTPKSWMQGLQEVFLFIAT